MKIASINNYQMSNNFKAGNVVPKKANMLKTAVAALGLAMLPLANNSCKKDEMVKPEQTTVAQPKDLVDFALRDLVNWFGLDTTGYTKILKQSYPLNDGSYYTVDTFQIPSGNDTMYSNGIYHYNTNINGQYDDMPYEAIWTKTTFNGEDAVKVEYTYPWETNPSCKLSMPQPEKVYYIPGVSGDNSVKMNIEPGTGGRAFDVNITKDSASYVVEDINVKNPFGVEVVENFNNNEIQSAKK